jgi:hypothetical protein
MPILLADAASKLDAWSLSPVTQGANMQVAYVKFDGKPATVQLTSKAELGTITTPWTPSVYRGTGNETRVKMTVSIPDAVREHMELIEEKVRDSLRAHSPKIDAIWHSSTKPGDKYPATLGSKIVLSGDNACRCVDADGKTVAMPSEWAGLAVIPIITIRGVHLQKTMAGLIMETTALLVGEVQQKDAGPVSFI